MHTTSTTFPLQLATTLHRCCRVVVQRIRTIEKGSWEGVQSTHMPVEWWLPIVLA